MSESADNSSNVPSKMEWVTLINESVHTSDDVDIGDVQAVSRIFVVVKRGFVNIHYYYIPINKVEGWDGYVLWLSISEKEVNENYERDTPPNPYRYYMRDYPYYASSYYPELKMIPSRYIIPSFGQLAAPQKYRCDLCNNEFGTEKELSNHVDHSH